MIFLSAEADPFSKSGGLANVVYELPRELALLGESAVVITPLYRSGDEKAMRKMNEACRRYGVAYTGRTIRFWIGDDGLRGRGTLRSGRWDPLLSAGSPRVLRRALLRGNRGRETSAAVAFARASAEVVREFALDPLAIFTNDAFAGVFAAILRGDPGYNGQSPFDRATLFHIIHNGGWQYFDAYQRFEQGAISSGFSICPIMKHGVSTIPVRRINSTVCSGDSLRR